MPRATWSSRFQQSIYLTLLLVAGLCVACGGRRSDNSTPDAAAHCASPAECSDGIACTTDSCTSAGTCKHIITDALCSTGDVCNPRTGCERSRVCGVDDDCKQADASIDVCVKDVCDPSARVCKYESLDGDGDGDPPQVCGGGDCDDSNANVHDGVEEVCNGIDDDCDGVADEASAATSCGVGAFVCAAGVCACAPGASQCGGCVDTRVDSENCGACGVVCAGNGICRGGACCIPTTETCNGRDDDCNGVVDDGLTPGACGMDACATNNGGCGDARFTSCVNNAGAPPTCSDINECATNNGGCDVLVTCTNNAGASHTCGPCPPGYIGSGATGCTDINECATNNGGCDQRTTCTNNVNGAPTCGSCPSGYVGTGTTGCADADECAISNGGCDSLTTCTNNLGTAATCGRCPNGYTGTGLAGCVDIDECAIEHGGCSTEPMVTCVNMPGSRTCGACPPGYQGTGVGNCTDTDECLANNGGCDADPLAACANTPGGRSCTCPTGYTTSDGGATCINACSGANVCAPEYPCQILDPAYVCRGQFPDWPVSSGPSFAVNNDGTVSDSRNDLLWQQASDSGLHDWAGAKAYCDGITLAGPGWRLPTMAELESIVDVARDRPAIDPTAFPSTASIRFWSSSPYAGSSSHAWTVSFDYGFSDIAVIGTLRGVRCVRSSAAVFTSAGSGGAPPGRYTIPASGVVFDRRTQLTWQQAVAPSSYLHSAAVAYCAGLSLNGSGWRLPSRPELLSLVDRTQYNPAIDQTAFAGTPSAQFWSSSPVGALAGSVWAVDFNSGQSSSYATTSFVYRVRCVR